MSTYEQELRARYAAARRRLFAPTRPKRGPKDRDWLLVASMDDPAPDLVAATAPEGWRKIVEDVCQKHGVSLNEIMSRRRRERVVAARHEAFARLYFETTMSTPKIGRRMGGRHHTTVLQGIRKHLERAGARLE